MDSFKEYLEEYRGAPHYYGDIVRVLFLIAGLVILICLPIFKDTIHLPLMLSILAVLAIGFLAGLTNPKIIWIIALDALASLAGFIIFEYVALIYFEENLLFALTNQILAIIFFIAIYYSTKTLRGFMLRKKG